MHGVKRGIERTEKEREEERKRCSEYQALTQKLLAKNKNRECDEKAFKLSTEILNINSEFSTGWNVRRRFILAQHVVEKEKEEEQKEENEEKEKEGKKEEEKEEKEEKEGKEEKKEEKERKEQNEEKEEKKEDEKKEEQKPKVLTNEEVLQKELRFTAALIRTHPKSYWLWFHRQWVCERLEEWFDSCDWKEERNLCTLFLKADSRNFHCWNYRRFVNEKAKVKTLDELDYTSKKIGENFSNYSAWHQRSLLLSRFQNDSNFSSRIEKEIEFVKNAFYTDTSDQSSWLYYRWLLAMIDDKEKLKEELEMIEEILSEEMGLNENEKKWPTLIRANLCQKIGGEEKANLPEVMKQLSNYDPYRKGYYADIYSQ